MSGKGTGNPWLKSVPPVAGDQGEEGRTFRIPTSSLELSQAIKGAAALKKAEEEDMLNRTRPSPPSVAFAPQQQPGSEPLYGNRPQKSRRTSKVRPHGPLWMRRVIAPISMLSYWQHASMQCLTRTSAAPC